MGFKLIAIRPLENCGEKFLKNLDINRIYKFYDNFEYYNGKDRIDNLIDANEFKKVDSVKEVNKLPNDFFTTKINISAIVGKNGSGKSSIIDLFIASLNQISINLRDKGILNTTAELQTTNTEKDSLIHCELYYQLNNNYFQILINDTNFDFVH